MIGLQIDCQLLTPWCPPAKQLHFDGLLAKGALRLAMDRPCADDANYEDFIHDLPLERHEFGHGEWVWKASVMHVVGWAGQSRLFMTERTPVTQMLLGIADGLLEKKGGSTIDTVRGYAKNGTAFITTEQAHGLRAWCVGDPDGIAEYLAEITAVGVKTRMGLGSLKPYDDGKLFKITPCQEAHSIWMRRHTPERLIEESTPITGRWKAPYWSGVNKTLCWAPKAARIALPTEIATTSATAATTAA